MKQKFFAILKSKKSFIVYCLIGLSGVTLDYLSFVLFVNWFSVNYQIANAISTSLGIINNFFLNTHFNFKTRDRLFARFISFYSIGLLGLLVSAGILYFGVSKLNFSPNYTKIFTLFVVVVLQYNLNRLVSFRK
jgi:putative flippase GtrA